jgi:acetate kinase
MVRRSGQKAQKARRRPSAHHAKAIVKAGGAGMRVMVLNSGSSSLKFRLLDFLEDEPEEEPRVPTALLTGAVKGIGGTATLEIATERGEGSTRTLDVPDHSAAMHRMFDHLISPSQIEAVGHRVVHGGDRFSQPVVIDETVLAEIEALVELAPLHNPASLAGILGARRVLGPTIPMVAVFDTAFHHTLSTPARIYALPHELAARHHIRRYGFHGIAHASLAAAYAAFTGRALEKDRLITLQLGNGCSVTAIAGGKSVDTSMGFTPLEGLVMGTRSGDVDPSIVTYLARQERVDASEVERWLNEKSGLLGLSGRTNDMRGLEAAAQAGDARAAVTIELFCYRARKYVGAYLAVLGGADAVVFGGGIGENSPTIRARICAGMEWCGLLLDLDRNKAAVQLPPGGAAKISQEKAGVAAYVVADDEETWIARETVRCLQRRSGRDA